MMCTILDQAVEEWNSLVERQECLAYKVQQPTSVASDRQNRYCRRHSWLTKKKIAIPSCPSVWREKICQWCFEVVDHWWVSTTESWCPLFIDLCYRLLNYIHPFISLQRYWSWCDRHCTLLLWSVYLQPAIISRWDSMSTCGRNFTLHRVETSQCKENNSFWHVSPERGAISNWPDIRYGEEYHHNFRLVYESTNLFTIFEHCEPYHWCRDRFNKWFIWDCRVLKILNRA